MDESRWVLLFVGCAECGDWPLVVPRGVFATAEEAAVAAGETERWKAHPSGGYMKQWGSGGWWIAPMDALATVADDGLMVSEFDSPQETVSLSA